MYLRTIRTQGREYVQLAHNRRDPQTGKPRAQILYHFGPKDRLDLEGLRRLVQSISRFLEPAEARQIQEQLGFAEAFQYLGSRQLGGSWLLDGLWQRLRLADTVKRLLVERHYRTPVERLLFALVANRALAPSSKLALEHWVTQVWIEELPEVEVHQLYRAMDFLLEAHDAIQREVYWTVANLLNLEVDVLFLDTTSTYFEIAGEDAEGLRQWGYSRDGRPHQAQVVIGFAVTRDGIPVRCWVWPGQTVDQNLVAEVKRDLNEWKLGRVLLVLDSGFNSEENRRILQGAGDHYILGERLRLGQQGVPAEALRRAGKYRVLEDGLAIKEVLVHQGSAVEQRFLVVRNPEEAERDRRRRAESITRLEKELAELEQLTGKPHTKKACALRAHPVLGRYLRQTKRGKLRLDKAKIRAEAQFDGKFLVRTSDPSLPAEDVVRGYKQLWQIERVHRDLKHTVDIRPVYHRLEERIRAHVLLCWLALLLIRVAENESGRSWHQLKLALASLDVGRHRLKSGEVWQTSPVTPEQKQLLAALQLPEPPRYPRIEPARA